MPGESQELFSLVIIAGIVVITSLSVAGMLKKRQVSAADAERVGQNCG